jgi:hypothetical protein
MPSYYKKEIPESGVIVFGQSLRFDLLETDDQRLIGELNKCVQRGVGGIIPLTKDQFDEEVKKKELSNLSNNNFRPQPQRQELKALNLPLDGRRVVEAISNPSPRIGMFARPQVPPPAAMQNGAAKPDPIEVPAPESFVIKPPPTMKVSLIEKT